MTVLFWGYLTIAALSLGLVLAFIGSLYVRQLELATYSSDKRKNRKC